MLNREELAYIAGLFDGEGYIGLRGRPDSRGFRLDIAVTSTSSQIIESFLDFGGRVDDQARRITLLRGWKNRQQWRMQGQEAVKFLRIMEPFLREKKDLALMAMEYWAQRTVSPHAVSDEEFALRSGYKLCMDYLRAG